MVADASPVACQVGVDDHRSLGQEILALEDLHDPCVEVGNRPCRTLAQEDPQAQDRPVLDEAFHALVEAAHRVVLDRDRDQDQDNRVRIHWEVGRRTLGEDVPLEEDRLGRDQDHQNLLDGIVAGDVDRPEASGRLCLQDQVEGGAHR